MDEWTTAATADDALAADLLLRLKHAGETWTSTTRTNVKAALGSASSSCGLAQFRWGRRKARSRHGVTRFVMNKEYKERDTRSPTTPLSWSGGGGTTSVSASGNAGGYEASSMMCQSSTASRSKISAAYDLAKSKRAKRKKTSDELKEEECSLLHERQNLERDLATLRATLTDHKMTNQSLKRIKSMNVQSRRMTASAAEPPFVCIPPPPSFSFQNAPEAESWKSYMLPDLNMLPSLD